MSKGNNIGIFLQIGLGFIALLYIPKLIKMTKGEVAENVVSPIADLNASGTSAGLGGISVTIGNWLSDTFGFSGSINRSLDNVYQWFAIAQRYAMEVGLDTYLVLAIIAQESEGNPNELGDGGTSYGLMQIKEGAWDDAKKIGSLLISNPTFSPSANIQAGTYYLKLQIERMGNTFDGIRAYSAGETGAKNDINNKRDYARNVLRIREAIKEELEA